MMRRTLAGRVVSRPGARHRLPLRLEELEPRVVPDAGPSLSDLPGPSVAAQAGLDAATQSLLANTASRSDLVHDLYWAWLGRDATPADLTFWSAQFQQGRTLGQMEITLLASDECYQGQGNTPSAWEQAAYRDLLGQPAPAALPAGAGPLDTAAGRLQLAAQVVSSPAGLSTLAADSQRRLNWPATPLWGSATGTDASSTLNVGLAPGTEAGLSQLAALTAAEGAALRPTAVSGLYTAQGGRAALTRLAEAYAGVAFVQFAEPQQVEQIARGPNDPEYVNGALYGMNGAHGINAPSAWDATTGNTSVVLASIDTGVDYDHPDLYQNIWLNQAEIPASRLKNLTDVDGDGKITFYDLNNPINQGPGKITDVNGDGRIDAADVLAPMQKDAGGNDTGLGGWADGVSEDGDTAHVDDLVGWNFVTNTNNPFDDNGHGTHTTGTMAAMGNDGIGVVGVDWTAQVMALKFLSSSGSGSDTAAAEAIRYAADHGARASNNSWGGGGSSTLENAITYAATKGEIFVAAAGNSGTDNDTSPFYPAAYHLPNMIVVAATDGGGNKASFSNYGPTTVDVGAPGVSIESTLPNASYGYESGTSMATPHVTGTVGLVLSQHPTWSSAQVISQVLSTTTPDAALSGLTVTGGVVNAAAAVDHDLWDGGAHDAQHTAVSVVPSQPLQAIRWQAPVDLQPQYSGNDLLIHYGSPVATRANTVIFPVKTGLAGGFEVEGVDGATGTVKWTQTTDYVLPQHDWVPSYGPTLTLGNRLYFAGAGGTVYYVNNPDAAGATISGQFAFFGLGNYSANKGAYNNTVFINTPLTADDAGNIYFGFMVTGANPLGLVSGVARVAPDGSGTWVSAAVAASDPAMTKVVHNAAPAVSNDGQSIYVPVSNANGTNNGVGYLVRLDSTTLQPLARVRLKDVEIPANDALLPDDGSASPTVGPDGDVYFGVLENNGQYASKGWLLHFSADLSQEKTPGAFGWDDTPSIVASSLVPSYAGASPYLLMTKYNNYADFGLDGVNKLAILDPNATEVDARTGATVMKEVLTIAGPTPDTYWRQHGAPAAVREWCINTAVVDPFSKSVLANSEDGKLYRWDLTTNTFTQVVTLTAGVGEAYTPTVVGPDGTVYAINNGTLFAVGLPGSATFLKSDGATQGYWQGAYGGDGFNVIDGGAPSYPSYATVTPSGNGDYVWAASTIDPRGLQKPASPADHVAAMWYSTTSFTVDVNLTDGKTHQVALYLLDWDDGGGRSERIDVLDGATGAVLDSETASNFGSGEYLVWSISGHVTFRVTRLSGPNATLSGLFFGPAGTPPSGTGSAAFVKSDGTTQGTWQGAYGGDGSNVIDGGAPSYPKYATVTPVGPADYVWAASTSDLRGLQKPANPSDRIAATWYAAGGFTVDVNLTDGQTHQVALYLLDWDGGGRSERIDVVDAVSGKVLDSRTAGGFGAGDYFVWTLGGHVLLRVTGLSGPNAVVSGLFFGTGKPPAGGGSATFLKSDGATQGYWQGAYGGDGFNVIDGGAPSYPSYATVTPSGNGDYVWQASTLDPRGLQKPANPADRVAAMWYSNTGFSVDVNLTGGLKHQVALYLLDWDGGGGRSERIDVLDGATGAVLDSETASNFGSGEYLVWSISGHVTFRVTRLAGPNAALSGLFFGPPGLPPAGDGSAQFVKADTSTHGTWQGAYGSDGLNVIDGGTPGYPPYAAVTPVGNADYVWASSTADPRALQKPAAPSDRVAAAWYAADNFSVNLNLSGGTHQVALYLLDWDGGGRGERIDVLDAVNGRLLGSQTASGFGSGEYLVWDLGGDVLVRITRLAGPNAVLSGLFFDPTAPA